MEVSNRFRFWQQHKPDSYIEPIISPKSMVSFDMGEWQPVKRSVPYPDPKQTKIKTAMGQKLGVEVSRLSLGAGSDEIIEHIPLVFMNPGDKALIIVPTFFRFIDATLKAGGVPVLLSTRKEDDFRITAATVSEINQLISKEKICLVWLCNPNNPTGTFIKQEFLEQLITSHPKILFVIDEVFSHALSQPRWGGFSNVICLRSFSKIDGLAGIRVGFSIASPEITEKLEAWRLPFNISKFSGDAVLKFLKNSSNSKITDSIITNEREHLFTEIRKLPSLEIGADSKTNIFLLRHRTRDLFLLLLDHGIKAADVRNTPGLSNLGFVRITIKSPRENSLLLEALRKIDKS